ncbi:polysaccharide deacetylase family protein [Gorillibacterium sp. CAU 1737]|uniref:polysaccharide deacetylase family protein n=1 Tax=Gorillibacterium sp. CAU 1737 TaxID=3140362 RepID=UPI00325FF9AA
MRKPNDRILIFAFVLVVAIIGASGPWLGVDAFVASVKINGEAGEVAVAYPSSGPADTPMKEEALRMRIQTEAANRSIPPINAQIDRVWKAIPGYNGVEVDQEKTLKLALARRISEKDPLPFVFSETKPSINLKDLAVEPIYKGNPEKPMVALMINVAWGEEYLPGMLETLLNENVRATFFFDGSWLSKNVELAKRIGAAGHELSNHAYSHPNMSQLSRTQAANEISKTETLLKEKLGVQNVWFAPPSGDFDEETVRIAKEQGLSTVLWTVDTVDWKKPAPSVIVRRVNSRVEPGSLILMHPTAPTRDALQEVIRSIKRKGLALGTVSEVLSTKRVTQLEWSDRIPLPGAGEAPVSINEYGGTP